MLGRAPMVARQARPRRLEPSLIVSLAVHLSVLIALLVTLRHEQPQLSEAAPPPAIAMVFQGKSPAWNAAPNPEHPELHAPGSATPAPAAPTAPPTPPVPNAPQALALPPPPPPPPPAPPNLTAPTELPAPPPVPAPQATAPAVPARPLPPLALAPLAPPVPRPTPRPIEPTRPEVSRPEPPRPLPPARPQREAPSREASRGPAFPTPMNFSLGSQPQPQSWANSQATRQPNQRGTIDMAYNPKAGGANQLSASVKMDGVDVSTDWLNAVSAWWRRHGYYPDEAGIRGEQGEVTLHMKVARDGQVSALELEARSGSQWLDMGALSVFRDAHLPPLTPDMPEGQIPLHFTIHYIIIRQN